CVKVVKRKSGVRWTCEYRTTLGAGRTSGTWAANASSRLEEPGTDGGVSNSRSPVTDQPGKLARVTCAGSVGLPALDSGRKRSVPSHKGAIWTSVTPGAGSKVISSVCG